MKIETRVGAVLGAILIGGTVGLGNSGGSASGPTDDFPTTHFILRYLRSEVHPKLVTPARLRKCADWLDTSYETIVGRDKLAFRQPKMEQDQGKFVVHLERMAFGLPGQFDRAQNRLRLNVLWVDITSDEPYNPGKPLMAATIAHELFHAVQNAYDPDEDRWFKEATARWVENEVFPGIDRCVGHELKFLDHMHLSLHLERYDENHLRVIGGHPYGASLFFRFLSKHRGAALVRKMHEEGASGNVDSLTAIAKALGGTQAVDKSFRDVLDRFAVGCVLNLQAPEPYKLPDVTLLKQPPVVDMTTRWHDHYATKFTSPETATVSFPRPGLCGCGTYFLKASKPPGLPDHVPLTVVSKDPDNELSLQGVVNVAGTWKVYASTHDEGYQRLQVPDYNRTHADAFIVMTRYSKDSGRKTFHVRLTAADPPVLSEITFSQRGTTVFSRAWKPKRDGDGLLLRRTKHDAPGNKPLDPGKGKAIVRLTFSRPVRVHDGRPLCRFDAATIDMTRVGDATTWEGTIGKSLIRKRPHKHIVTVQAETVQAGSQAALPLDQDPLTLARRVRDWMDYEREEPGMRIRLGAEPGGFQTGDAERAHGFWKPIESGAEPLRMWGTFRMAQMECTYQVQCLTTAEEAAKKLRSKVDEWRSFTTQRQQWANAQSLPFKKIEKLETDGGLTYATWKTGRKDGKTIGQVQLVYRDVFWIDFRITVPIYSRNVIPHLEATLDQTKHTINLRFRSGKPVTGGGGPSQGDPPASGGAAVAVDTRRLSGLVWANRLNEALVEYRRLAEAHPDHVTIRTGRASMELVVGDRDVASAEAQTLLRQFPDHPNVLVLAGQAAYFQGDAQTARRMFDRAKAVHPTQGDELYNQAVKLHGRRVHGLARLLFATAVAMDPQKHYRAHYYLGAIFEVQGSAEKAIHAYEAYLRADATSNWADAARTRIAQLRSRPGR